MQRFRHLRARLASLSAPGTSLIPSVVTSSHMKDMETAPEAKHYLRAHEQGCILLLFFTSTKTLGLLLQGQQDVSQLSFAPVTH